MNERHTQACYQRLADRINSHRPEGENYDITIDARDLYWVLKAMEAKSFEPTARFVETKGMPERAPRQPGKEAIQK